MQAYCVSKRPPRALFLALAIALGVVAVSAAVLPMVGGGLMRDGTYLRLLGYTPSNRGATLTAQSAADAGSARGAGRVFQPLRRSGRLPVGPGERIGPAAGSGRHGCARDPRSERDPR